MGGCVLSLVNNNGLTVANHFEGHGLHAAWRKDLKVNQKFLLFCCRENKNVDKRTEFSSVHFSQPFLETLKPDCEHALAMNGIMCSFQNDAEFVQYLVGRYCRSSLQPQFPQIPTPMNSVRITMQVPLSSFWTSTSKGWNSVSQCFFSISNVSMSLADNGSILFSSMLQVLFRVTEGMLKVV